jgi:endoglucanase
MIDTFEVLKKLTDLAGVTGEEETVAEYIAGLFPKCECEHKDGSLIVRLNEKSDTRKTLLIDAHIDRIGLIVTHITDGGFLKVGNVGGVDTRMLAANRVFIGEKRIPGVIATKPPHLSGSDKKPLAIADVVIDTGMDKETVEKHIAPGDRIMFYAPCERLKNDTVAASALDNRAGAAIVIRAGLKLLENGICGDYNVVLLFSAAEEVTERGATISAFGIRPDICLVVDTSFTAVKGEDETKCGKVGGGVMIGVSSTLDSALSKTLFETAKKSGIPYQTEVMPSRTGTNADVISVTAGGVKTATLSFPIKYMHTPSETVSVADMDSTVRLITAFAGGAV